MSARIFLAAAARIGERRQHGDPLEELAPLLAEALAALKCFRPRRRHAVLVGLQAVAESALHGAAEHGPKTDENGARGCHQRCHAPTDDDDRGHADRTTSGFAGIAGTNDLRNASPSHDDSRPSREDQEADL